MKRILIILLFCCIPFVYADQTFNTSDGQYIIRDSSIANPGDGKMHTYMVIFKPNSLNEKGLPEGGETPASISCVYGFTKQVPGCPIKGTTQLPTGGWGAIAIVDAYDNPDAESDLNTFSSQFGLPACTIANGCFKVVYAKGTKPAFNAGWADEHVLDIEWSHAMAPHAKIILVEAASDSNSDMLQAEDVASSEVLAAGGGLVSNSWGGSESSDETSHDSHFQTSGIVYVASSGDYSAPARYPSSSPYVVSAGGTSIIRDSSGNFSSEIAWGTEPDVPIGSKSGASGGPSVYESRPSYQKFISKIVGRSRGTPDISFNSAPHTGVDVYSTNAGGWIKDGGTSVASPALAGIINSANHRATSTNQELTYIYNNALKNYHSYWHDILSGNNGFPCMAGYDFVTGLGSPLGYGGK